MGGGLRLELAHYRELSAFAQFASDLDAATRQQIERGKRGMEVLKQDENAPQSISQMTSILYALGHGDLDDIEVSKVVAFEKSFLSFLEHERKSLVDALNEKMALTDQIVEDLNKAISDFKATGTW